MLKHVDYEAPTEFIHGEEIQSYYLRPIEQINIEHAKYKNHGTGVLRA